MNQRQERVRRKWEMSGNVWMFSDEIDDEDLEFMSCDQMSLVEYIDPFTGEPVKKNKK